jgi:hypothetical protein
MASQLRFWVAGEVGGMDVLVGRDRWLFFRDSVVGVCSDEAAIDVQVANLKKLADALQEAGIPLLFVAAPDKPSIYPDKLTPLMLEAGSCWEQNRAAISRATLDQGISHWNGWQDLVDARRASTNLLYFEDDTHWTQWGSIRFSAWIVKSLAPELTLAPPRQAGTEVRTPDLSRMAGLHRTIEAPVVEFDRPRQQARSRKRILFLHDSFMDAALGQISQYFDDTVYVHWSAFATDRFAAMASAADAVVIEVVERDSYRRLQEFFSDDRMAVAFRSLPEDARAAALGAWPRTR